MRDPVRIPRMLNKLYAVWLRNPDLRLGQLVVNLATDEGSTYHAEDNRIEAILDHELENWVKL